MIHFEPTTAADFATYVDRAIAEYAADHVKSGRWTEEEALEKSRQEFAELLPQGVATPDHYIYSVFNDAGERVGILWLNMRGEGARRSAWIYEIEIFSAYRRQGYGEAAFHEMERRVRELGGHKVGLHVFGHNAPAYAMYTKLGYQPKNIRMEKELE